MRLASGLHALRLLGAIGSRRAFPCRTAGGAVVFRVSYSVVEHAVPSVEPPRRDIVPRCLVPGSMRAMRLGRLPPCALGRARSLPPSRGLRRACEYPASTASSILPVAVCFAGGVLGPPILFSMPLRAIVVSYGCPPLPLSGSSPFVCLASARILRCACASTPRRRLSGCPFLPVDRWLAGLFSLSTSLYREIAGESVSPSLGLLPGRAYTLR